MQRTRFQRGRTEGNAAEAAEETRRAERGSGDTDVSLQKRPKRLSDKSERSRLRAFAAAAAAENNRRFWVPGGPSCGGRRQAAWPKLDRQSGAQCYHRCAPSFLSWVEHWWSLPGIAVIIRVDSEVQVVAGGPVADLDPKYVLDKGRTCQKNFKGNDILLTSVAAKSSFG